MVTSKTAPSDAVNAAFKAAAEGPLKGILEYNDEQTVSVDYNGNPHSAIFDSTNTMVMGDNLRQGDGLVRQRVGLLQPHGGHGEVPRLQGSVVAVQRAFRVRGPR